MTKLSVSRIFAKCIRFLFESFWTLTARYHQLGVSGAGPYFNGLGLIDLRPDFENCGKVGEVIVELNEDVECWSPDDRLCFGVES